MQQASFLKSSSKVNERINKIFRQGQPTKDKRAQTDHIIEKNLKSSLGSPFKFQKLFSGKRTA